MKKKKELLKELSKGPDQEKLLKDKFKEMIKESLENPSYPE